MSKQTLGWMTASILVGITIALHLLADSPAKLGNVTEARLTSEADDGSNWLLNGRTFDEQHFSPLKQITDKNASTLGLAWSLGIDSAMGVVAEPLVVDGVIYVSAPLSKVYAIEATTGKLLWKFTVGAPVVSGPMTYSVNGRQYVTVAAGSSLFAFALRQ